MLHHLLHLTTLSKSVIKISLQTNIEFKAIYFINTYIFTSQAPYLQEYTQYLLP